MGAAAVEASHGRCRGAVRTGARGRPRTPVRGRGGPGTCRAAATCVHDRARGEPPGGRPGSRSTPVAAATAAVVHGTPAGRTRESTTKFLPRDHAPAQLPGCSVLAAKRGHADGAHAPPRRARFWPQRPGVAAPAAAPLASAGPAAGIPRPGSNAGSNAAAGTGAHSLCAGRSAAAVGADWHGGGTLEYHENSPRERRSPKGQPGGSAFSFSSGVCQHQQAEGRSPVYFPEGTRWGRKRVEKSRGPGDAARAIRKSSPVRRPRKEPDKEGNSLRKARPKRRARTRPQRYHPAWRSSHAHNWL
jgi:hypothetical protein